MLPAHSAYGVVVACQRDNQYDNKHQLNIGRIGVCGYFLLAGVLRWRRQQTRRVT